MKSSVFFRAFEVDDAILINKWKNDDTINSQTIGLNRKICYEDNLEWVKSKMHHLPYEVYWAICANDGSQKMIGWAYLTDIHFIHRSANFGGIIIADPDYHNGLEWIDSYKFVLEYAFERLNLNRLYGTKLVDHKQSMLISKIMYFQQEGVYRQSVFKDGRYHDVSVSSILQKEYFEHLNNGDYELPQILMRLRQYKKN